MRSVIQEISGRKVLRLIPYFFIAVGSITRVVVYLQNRNLFIDEANIARNIFERGYKGLLLPLSYEQYAPPLFLWIIKTFTLTGANSEYALRLFPLLAGIAALLLMSKALRAVAGNSAAWYPLALMCVGFIFTRYATELKQYMCDVLCATGLILLALRVEIISSKKSFAAIWLATGSIAIWTSMPSVFILTGVVSYYLYKSIVAKDRVALLAVIAVAAIWISEFAAYYFTILKSQISTPYLSDYHMKYFLSFSFDARQNLANWQLIKTLLNEAGGYAPYALVVNVVLLSTGAAMLLKKNTATGLLLVAPLVALLGAAFMHQYSLIPRVSLFIFPVFLLLIGYGYSCLLARLHEKMFVIAQLAALALVVRHSMIRMIYKPFKNEEITVSLNFLKQNNIAGDKLYVDLGAQPAFIYYTQIHPKSGQWQQLKNAHLLSYGEYNIAGKIQDTCAFLFSAIGPDELAACKKTIESYCRQVNKIEVEPGREYAYIYTKK